MKPSASGVRGWAIVLLGAGLLCFPGGPLRAQIGATLAGVIVSNSTGEGLPGATVSLIGRGVEATADENGEFLIEGLPSGAVRVRFEAPGHVSVVEDLEASDGAYFRVRLSPVEAILEEILVLAGRRRFHDGSQSVDVKERADGWRSVLDLLEDQVPGVVVRRGGGNLGTGAYVFIRGAGTLQGDNAPDVYLDGTRLDGENPDSRTLHTLDLISAEEVSSVRVYKGASGGAGFALGGANGAIVIETNRGRAPRAAN